MYTIAANSRPVKGMHITDGINSCRVDLRKLNHESLRLPPNYRG